MSVATVLPGAPLTSAGAPPSRRTRAQVRPALRRPKLGPVGHRTSHASASGPLVLTRRGAFLVRIAAVAAVAIIVFGLWQAVQPLAPEVIGTRTVTVRPGESAWAIAESINPGVDPRVTIGLIEEANGLRSASLVRPGTELVVPVFAAGERVRHADERPDPTL